MRSPPRRQRKQRFSRRKKRLPVGARPGTLAISEASPPPKIRWTRYTESALDEVEVTDVAALDAALEPEAVSWVDVQGLGDEKLLRELGDAARETARGLMNTYLSVVGQRTNEVMKVLTIVASIFVPLTFMAGIYGMNFEHMPELEHPWGYPALLMAMLVLGIGMIFYFRRQGWIGSGDEPDDDPQD